MSLAAGLVAGSAALIGFGIDSVIEVTASGAARWRLNAELNATQRERIERATARIIAWSLLALAAYVTYDSITSLAAREHPEKSTVGVTVLALSIVVMSVVGWWWADSAAALAMVPIIAGEGIGGLRRAGPHQP